MFRSPAFTLYSLLLLVFLLPASGCIPIDYRIDRIDPPSATIGDTITITGAGFGSVQGTSEVVFGNDLAAPEILSWSDTTISLKVPGGALSGPLRVEKADSTTNAVTFNVNLGQKMLDLSPDIYVDPVRIRDSSGHANHAEIEEGMYWIPDKTGTFGKAVLFEAPGTYATLASDRGLRHLEGLVLIVDAVITDPDATEMTIINKRDCFDLKVVKGWDGYFLLFTFWDSNHESHTVASKPSLATIPYNEWFNTAVLYDGETVSLYVDGTPAGSRDIGSYSMIADITSGVTLGARHDGAFPLNGSLGDVTLFDFNVEDTPGDLVDELFRKLDQLMAALNSRNVAPEETQGVMDDLFEVMQTDWKQDLADIDLLVLENEIRTQGAIEAIDEALAFFPDFAPGASASGSLQSSSVAVAAPEDWNAEALKGIQIAGACLDLIGGVLIRVGTPPTIAAGTILMTTGIVMNHVADAVLVAVDMTAPTISSPASSEIQVSIYETFGFTVLDATTDGGFFGGVTFATYELRNQNGEVISDPYAAGIIANPQPGENLVKSPPTLGGFGRGRERLYLTLALRTEKGWYKDPDKQNFTIVVTARDYYGHESAPHSRRISVRNTSPTVSAVRMELPEVKTEDDLLNQWAVFNLWDPDQNVTRAALRLSGDPVVFKEWYLTDDIIPNWFALQIEVLSKLIPLGANPSSYINLDVSGEVYVQLKVWDSSGAESNTLIFAFYVKGPQVKYRTIPLTATWASQNSCGNTLLTGTFPNISASRAEIVGITMSTTYGLPDVSWADVRNLFPDGFLIEPCQGLPDDEFYLRRSYLGPGECIESFDRNELCASYSGYRTYSNSGYYVYRNQPVRLVVHETAEGGQFGILSEEAKIRLRLKYYE